MAKQGKKRTWIVWILIYLLFMGIRSAEVFFLRTDEGMIGGNIFHALLILLFLPLLTLLFHMKGRESGWHVKGLFRALGFGFLIGALSVLGGLAAEIFLSLRLGMDLSIGFYMCPPFGRGVIKTAPGILLCIFACLAAAACEEGFFRGILIRDLLKTQSRRRTAVFQAVLYAFWYLPLLIRGLTDGDLKLQNFLLLTVAFLPVLFAKGLRRSMLMRLTGSVWAGIADEWFFRLFGIFLLHTGVPEDLHMLAVRILAAEIAAFIIVGLIYTGRVEEDAPKSIARHITHERKIDFLWITLGTLLMALATNLFYSPAHMVPGGFTGLAIILRHVIELLFHRDVPIWFWNIVLNVPLILFSIKIRGKSFIKRTLLASVLFSAWLYIIPEYMLIEDDILLLTVVGGAVMGLGLGIVFLGKATTGGTDTLAALIQRIMPHVSVARILPFLDAAVILLSIWIFGLNISLYAVITVVISDILADKVMLGAKNSNVAYIISDRYEEIAGEVMTEMDRGTTLLKGKGMYTSTDKPVLFVAVSPKQTVILKEIVYDLDPCAFMIILDANEVRGEGFLRYTKEEL